MPTPRNVQEISFLGKQNKNIKYKYFTLKIGSIFSTISH